MESETMFCLNFGFGSTFVSISVPGFCYKTKINSSRKLSSQKKHLRPVKSVT